MSLPKGLAYRRITNELSLGEVVDGIRLTMVDDCWDHLEASFSGPKDSPFAGGTFVLDVRLPSAFPCAAPHVGL